MVGDVRSVGRGGGRKWGDVAMGSVGIGEHCVCGCQGVGKGEESG